MLVNPDLRAARAARGVALRLGYQSQEESVRAAVLRQFPRLLEGQGRPANRWELSGRASIS